MDFVNTFFEQRVERLFDLAAIVHRAFQAAGLDYRVIGGLATYLYAEDREPDAGRLTKDIDIVVRREDLDAIARAVEPFGLQYRHVAGMDMLLQTESPSARRAVHMIFSGEKVREEYSERTPEIGPFREIQGIRLVPLEDLIRMKLISFRLKDQMHLKDLCDLNLISPSIDATLSDILRERLSQIRERE